MTTRDEKQISCLTAAKIAKGDLKKAEKTRMKAITKLFVPQGSGLIVTINKINGNRAEIHRQGGYYWLNLSELEILN